MSDERATNSRRLTRLPLIPLLSAALALGGSACTPDESPTGPPAAAGPEFAAARTYTAVDLGLGVSGQATGINPAGQIAGWTFLNSFIWDKGVVTDLGTLGGGYSEATGINPAGQIVGNSIIQGVGSMPSSGRRA